MKNKLALLICCLYAYTGIGQAAEVSHYTEFARAYGIVRYFSPNPYTLNWSESDWMKVCTLLANRAETQPLEKVLEPLSPTLFFSDRPIQTQEDTTYTNNLASYYYYSGSGDLNIPLIAKLLTPGLANYIPYYKQLSTVANKQDSAIIPAACRYYTYRVSAERYLNIQHALPKEAFDKKATRRLLTDAKKYWNNHESADKTIPKRRSFVLGLLSDKAVRIADLTVRWNIIRHFYPYYEEDNLNWDKQLEIYLQNAIQIDSINTFESIVEWYNLISRFFNPIKDGHLFIRRDITISNVLSTYLPEYYAAIETKFVNDTLLIRIGTDSTQTWRMLHTINGKPTYESLQSCRKITNAATDAHRDNMAVYKIFSSPVYDTKFHILSSDISGHMREDTIRALYSEYPILKHENQSIRKYENGILYIDATSPDLKEKQFLSALTPDIKALCFDLRGLPSLQFEAILSHLIGSDIMAPTTEISINCFPFQQTISWRMESEKLKALLPHVDLPATFLCDANTVSWGETILMMVHHYALGKIIGQTTAGTTGDMTQFDLPMFPFSMTGMRMHGMDGEQHHARGIIPDKIVTVYAQDYINNYDRILYTVLNTIE